MSRRLLALGLGVAVLAAAALLLRPIRQETPPPSAAAPGTTMPVRPKSPAAAPATPDAPRRPGTLTLAVWSLKPRSEPRSVGSFDSAPAAVDPARPAPGNDQQTWRTTFGAERRDRPRHGRDATGLAADVVALAGVTHMQDVVRTFSRRDYFAVLSRQLLAAAGDRPATPTTALAVQRTEGLRVTLQDHLLLRRPVTRTAPAAPPSATADTRDNPSLQPVTEAETVAAAVTAVRLVADGRPLWLVAVDFSADCADPMASDDEPRCPAHDRRLAALAEWIASHRDGTFRAIFAGTGAGRVRAMDADIEVRPVSIKLPGGCQRADASITLVRERVAPSLTVTGARMMPRQAHERCALLAEIAH
ncbi:MAG: hypothetical protein R3D27_08290 [Hyphomicrobiaceae bacterium]